MSDQQQQKGDSARILPGHKLLRSLVEGLGLGDRCVRRVVLDVNMNDVVRVYVEEMARPEALTALAAELPEVQPFVQWVDRVKVENAEGTAIQVKTLAGADTKNRMLMLAFLEKLESATFEERRAITEMLLGAPQQQQPEG